MDLLDKQLEDIQSMMQELQEFRGLCRQRLEQMINNE